MFLFVVPVAAQVFTASMGDRSEARIRFDGEAQYLDILSQARMTLHLKMKRVDWTLNYSPSFSRLGIGSETSSDLLQHTGSLLANLRLTRKTTLFFSESATFGRQYLPLLGFGLLASNPNDSGSVSSSTSTGTPSTNGNSSQPGNVPPGGISPNITSTSTEPRGSRRVITLGTVSSSIGLSYRASKRWSFVGIAGASLSQGLDSYSRSIMPRAETVFGSFSATTTVTRRDTLSITSNGQRTVTRLETEPVSFVQSGSDSRIPDVRKSGLGNVGVIWSHRFSRRLFGNVGSGVSVGYYEDIGGRMLLRLQPTAYGGLVYFRNWADQSITLGAQENLAPVVDRFTGTVVTRTTSTANFTWTKRKVSLLAVGSWSSSIGGTDEVQSLRGTYSAAELARYHADRHWSFEIGVRQTWSSYVNVDSQPIIWGAFFAIVFDTGSFPLQ
jgi:hypothetical protein